MTTANRRRLRFARLTAGLVLVAAGSSELLAQRSPTVRRVTHRVARYVEPPIMGSLRTTNDANQASVDYVWFDGSTSFEMASSFEAVGGLQWLPGNGSKVFLASGATSLGNAQNPPASRIDVLQLVTSPAQNIAVLQSSAYPGIDAIAVAWDGATNMLFVADSSANEVRWAPWGGSGTALPTALLPALGAAQVPVLSSGDDLALLVIPGGVRVYDPLLGIGSDATWSGSSWTFAPYDPRSEPATPRWFVANALGTPAVGSFSLQLLGSSNIATYECNPMLDQLSVPVFSGTHPGSGALAVACPGIFHDLPGRPYSITGAGHRAETIVPLVNYGTAVSTQNLSILANLTVPSLHCFVGVQQLFGLSCQVKLNGPNGAGTTRNGYLILGVRNLSGDPVGPIGSAGGYTITAGASVVPFQVTFPPNTTERIARCRFDIPNEPLLENVVALFQVAIEDGAGGLAYTSVRATSILPAWVDPRAQFGVGVAQGNRQASQNSRLLRTPTDYLAELRERRQATFRPAVRRAAYAWLGLDERGEARSAQRAALERLRGLMAR